jgi:hypothetical protein
MPTSRSGGPLNFRDVFYIEPAIGLWLVVVAGLLGTILSLVLLWQTRPQVAGPPVRSPAQPDAMSLDDSERGASL